MNPSTRPVPPARSIRHDRVSGASEHRRPRENLSARVRRAGAHPPLDQPQQTQTVHQRGRQDQARVGDQALMIEGRCEPVQTARYRHKKCTLTSQSSQPGGREPHRVGGSQPTDGFVGSSVWGRVAAGLVRVCGPARFGACGTGVRGWCGWWRVGLGCAARGAERRLR